MATQRTVSEAKRFITQTIDKWEDAGHEKKIITLANWAENWSKNLKHPDHDKMIKLKKAMTQLQRNIDQLSRLGQNVTTLIAQKKAMEKEVASYESENGTIAVSKQKRVGADGGLKTKPQTTMAKLFKENKTYEKLLMAQSEGSGLYIEIKDKMDANKKELNKLEKVWGTYKPKR